MKRIFNDRERLVQKKEECTGKRLRIGRRQCDRARQRSEEMSQKKRIGGNVLVGQITHLIRLGCAAESKTRKPDIMNKDNEYAGKQRSSGLVKAEPEHELLLSPARITSEKPTFTH
jgi:hypothetical protein